MKLIVGLGNPGRKYEATRHNIGFDVVEGLRRRFGDSRYGDVGYKVNFGGEMLQLEIAGEQVLLVRPLTYMNLSGNCVGKVLDFYKVDRGDVLVVCDDFHLNVGKLRLRAKGSSGGQKGLANIIERLGGEEIARLRIGVGPVDEHLDPADFVLRKFSASQREIVEESVERGVDAAVCWVEHGIEEAMNRFNGADAN
jgi:PTH1 family peptidyl-tRNA hydrolase